MATMAFKACTDVDTEGQIVTRGEQVSHVNHVGGALHWQLWRWTWGGRWWPVWLLASWYKRPPRRSWWLQTENKHIRLNLAHPVSSARSNNCSSYTQMLCHFYIRVFIYLFPLSGKQEVLKINTNHLLIQSSSHGPTEFGDQRSKHVYKFLLQKIYQALIGWLLVGNRAKQKTEVAHRP